MRTAAIGGVVFGAAVLVAVLSRNWYAASGWLVAWLLYRTEGDTP